MFDVLSIVRGLLKFGNLIAGYFKDQQLIDSGVNKEKARQSGEQIRRINKGLAASRSVVTDVNSVRNDPANRSG